MALRDFAGAWPVAVHTLNFTGTLNSQTINSTYNLTVTPYERDSALVGCQGFLAANCRNLGASPQLRCRWL